MKTIDCVLLAAGGYLLYLLVTRKESTGPIQEIPEVSDDNHVPVKIITNVATHENTLAREQNTLQSEKLIREISYGGDFVNSVSTDTKKNNPDTPNIVQPIVMDSDNGDGANSYASMIDIPNLFGIIGSEKTTRSAVLKDSEKYDLEEIPFYKLSECTKTVLLQCFSSDYTSPRMIKDDMLYNNAIVATNKTGAPAGWIQYISCLKVSNGSNPNSISSESLHAAAIKMLEICEQYTTQHNTVNLQLMRNNAINCGLQILSSY